MNCTHFQVKKFSMAAIGLAMLAAVVILVGIAVPAQAQTYLVRFPDPTTFVVNNDVSGSVSPRSMGRSGRLQWRRQTRRRLHGERRRDL